MAIGRKPIPAELHRLRGTWRRDRHKKDQPAPPAGVTMPRGVLPKSAIAVWHDLAPALEEIGLLTVTDRPLFMMVCLWAGVAADAARELRADGILPADDKGRAAKHRALTILRAASAELRQLSGCFGLSPADRARLNVQPAEEPDTLADLLARRYDDEEGSASEQGSNGGAVAGRCPEPAAVSEERV